MHCALQDDGVDRILNLSAVFASFGRPREPSCPHEGARPVSMAGKNRLVSVRWGHKRPTTVFGRHPRPLNLSWTNPIEATKI
ncbi:hypothetical protein CBM2626_A230002 [Cupriavidus taiwanensis]|nr:hypothetical protein CBM2626_A230002 [Cupriavidus taiwanensis]